MALDQKAFAPLEASVPPFIQARLAPAENYVEEHGGVPQDIVDEMKTMGWFWRTIPEQYGGLGLSMAQACEVPYEFGPAALAFCSVMRTNIGNGPQCILPTKTTELHRRGEILHLLTMPYTMYDEPPGATRAHRDRFGVLMKVVACATS